VVRQVRLGMDRFLSGQEELRAPPVRCESTTMGGTAWVKGALRRPSIFNSIETSVSLGARFAAASRLASLPLHIKSGMPL
jgi:hypothetical protein